MGSLERMLQTRVNRNPTAGNDEDDENDQRPQRDTVNLRTPVQGKSARWQQLKEQADRNLYGLNTGDLEDVNALMVRIHAWLTLGVDLEYLNFPALGIFFDLKGTCVMTICLIFFLHSGC